jgi:hypothetical protein
MQYESAERDANNNPNRTEREKLLWESISKNWILTYERELAWVQILLCWFKKVINT